MADLSALAKRLSVALSGAAALDDPEVWAAALSRAEHELRHFLPNVNIVDFLGGSVTTEAQANLILGYDANHALRGMAGKVADKLAETEATGGSLTTAINAMLGLAKRTDNLEGDWTHTGEQYDVIVAAQDSGLYLVWVAERNACPRCLDLAGSVVPPGGAFSGNGLSGGGPSAKQPPLHPNCRCELKEIEPGDPGGYAAGLRREAARSAALGLSDFASRKQLVELAGNVASAAPYLPRSVLARAARFATTGDVPTRPQGV